MFKYDIDDEIKVNSIIKASGKVKDRLSKQDIRLYQVKIIDGKYKDKLFWFVENELDQR